MTTTPGALARAARFRVPLGFVFGPLAIWLARPTFGTIAAGAAIACVGEALRIWAAGHLYKSREVTSSGPYRWFAHPLYVGSSIMGAGLAVATNSLAAALLTAIYLGVTIAVAIKAEEAFLRGRFGGDYDRYRSGGGSTAVRRFALSQVMANREYRSVIGLLVVLSALLLKRVW